MSNFNLPEAVSIAASGNEALKASREDYVVWCATWWHAFFSQTGVPGRVDGCAALAKAIGRAGDPTDARWDAETLTPESASSGTEHALRAGPFGGFLLAAMSEYSSHYHTPWSLDQKGTSCDT